MSRGAAIIEIPILFRGDMVRAIFAGIKDNTRRPRGLADINVRPDDWREPEYSTTGLWHFARRSIGVPSDRYLRCPFGGPGSTLWAREAWAPADAMMAGDTELDEPCAIAYQADNTARWWGADNPGAPIDTYAWAWERFKWRPSIFMPRWACRLRLEVVSVRPERVQSITEDDARREGIAITYHDGDGCAAQDGLVGPCGSGCTGYRRAFQSAWTSMHGDSWDRNEWCWRVEFRSRIAGQSHLTVNSKGSSPGSTVATCPPPGSRQYLA